MNKDDLTQKIEWLLRDAESSGLSLDDIEAASDDALAYFMNSHIDWSKIPHKIIEGPS